MKSVNPYLNFDGNTLEAFQFYKSVFGGDFGFNMGYFADDEVLPPRNSRRANYALLADAPSEKAHAV